MSYREDDNLNDKKISKQKTKQKNRQNPKKYLTPMIAVGVFMIFIVISALLSRQSIRRFLIILLLFSIIALCGYFIYCLRQAGKERRREESDQEEEAGLRRRMPLRTELSAEDEEPQTERTRVRRHSYEYDKETEPGDNMYGMEDEPMAFDTNRARRPADASIIRTEDPGEGDFEDYQLEMEVIPETQEQPVGAAEEDNGPRYERRPIERPAFRGFARTLDNRHSDVFAQDTESQTQHRTTFEPARDTNGTFQGDSDVNAKPESEEQTAPKQTRETVFTTTKPFSIPSLEDEEPAAPKAAEPERPANTDEVVRPVSREYRRNTDTASDKGYQDSYNQDNLFQGTGASTPKRPTKPADTGLFGGSGYRSPFDK